MAKFEAALAGLEAELASLGPETAPDAAAERLAAPVRAFDAAAREMLS